MRRTVTPRALLSNVRVLARRFVIACVQREARKKIVNACLRQAVVHPIDIAMAVAYENVNVVSEHRGRQQG
jgi:hypothetical protein